MAQYKLAVIGECMAEVSGQPFGALTQGFGGDSMNTAIYLNTLLPGQVSYVTAMGTDGLSQAIVDKWQDYGIDTQFVLTSEERHVGLYMIQNDASGERFFQYWRNDSAARYMLRHSDYPRVMASLESYDAVFISGISVAILPPEDRFAFIESLQALKSKGVKVIFDGNFRPKLWASMEQARELYTALYELSDLALVTFDDEQQLWADANVDECRIRLGKFQIPELVIKDGKNGCFYVDENGVTEVTTTPVETVVDTTAAGDSFNAGFLSGWFANKTPVQCCGLGNAVAGQVIQQKGAIVPLNLSVLEG